MGAITVGIAHFFDFQIETIPKLANPKQSDLIQLFRIWGFLGTWVLIAITAHLLVKSERQGTITGWKQHLYRKEWLLLASPFLSGGAAEIGKLFIRRLRPHGDSYYIYRSWLLDPFRSYGLGFPSSHTAVAFGGSTILLLLFPKLRFPAIFMASGCMATRVLTGAHYFSDGVAGALIGVISGILCVKIYGYLNRPSQGDMASIPYSALTPDFKKRLGWEPITEGTQVTANVQVSDRA
jgi:membrane-associated phospholipid phosphatase